MKLLRPLIIPLFALGACTGGSTTTERAERAEGDATAGGEMRSAADSLARRTPPRPDDLGPVAAPAGEIALFRVGPLPATFEAFGRLLGASDEAATALERIRGVESGGGVLADQIAPDGGLEIAIVVVDDDMHDVYAFRGPSMQTVVAALPVGTPLDPRSDGSLSLPRGEGATERSRACSVEPTVDPESTRIVCSRNQDALDAVRQALARNVLGDVAPGTALASVSVESIRASWGEQVRGGIMLATTALESALSESESVVLRNPAVSAAIVRLAHDILDDASSFVEELSAYELSLSVVGDTLDVDGSMAFRNATGSLVRALAETFASTAPVSEDLLRHLPPGAVAYGTGHWQGRGFEDLSTEIRDVVAALVRAGIQLSQADSDALERGLAYAFRPMTYDFGVASGFDPSAQQWSVVNARYASAAEATTAITAVRQMVAVLRRPAVAQAIDALFRDLGEDRPRFAAIAEVRTRGLPTGSYAVRMPPFEVLASRFIAQRFGTEIPAQAAPAMRELLMVPNGQDVLIVQATNAMALQRELASSGGVASEIRSALLTPGAAATIVVRLGNVRLPNQPVDDDAGAPTLESVIGVEAGQAITVVRFTNTGTAPDVRFDVDTVIPGVVLRGFAHANETQ